jgi:hypothetical protein
MVRFDRIIPGKFPENSTLFFAEYYPTTKAESIVYNLESR